MKIEFTIPGCPCDVCGGYGQPEMLCPNCNLFSEFRCDIGDDSFDVDAFSFMDNPSEYNGLPVSIICDNCHAKYKVDYDMDKEQNKQLWEVGR